jgi:hypothetical protein
MAKPSDIDGVREHVVDMASRDQAAAHCSPRPSNSNRQANVFGVENGLQSHHAAEREVAPEEVANEFGVFLNDMKNAG